MSRSIPLLRPRYPLAVLIVIALVAVVLPPASNHVTHAQGLTLRIAIISDYGSPWSGTEQVASMVNSWDPDYIVTLGDNNQGEAANKRWTTFAHLDEFIGQHYHDYLYPYTGVYGEGSPTKRFYPAIGNHDWDTIQANIKDGTTDYYDFFGMTAGERLYYDYTLGPIHFFALNSDWEEPDGDDPDSVQAQWLYSQLQASTAPWQIVISHHPPYSSSSRGPKLDMRWAFEQNGADVVLSGHDHIYERLSVDGFPYMVNGLGGGGSLDDFAAAPDPNSQFRYNASFGAQLITANECGISFEFFAVTGGSGTLLDSYVVGNPDSCGQTPPAAYDDSYSMDSNSTLNIAGPGVLGNDTDSENDPLTALLNTGPTNGSLTLNADGSFTYTPDANYEGTDTFTYVAHDGTDVSLPASVNIIVNSVMASAPLYGAASPFNQPIPPDATYTPEDRIGSFRHGYEEWSMPIYRVSSDTSYPLVEVINTNSGRVEQWPIPPFAQPGPEQDAHLAVMYPDSNIIYEFWDAHWVDSDTINAGGMHDFPLDGSGISDPVYYRVTASGFAVSAGMLVREDFIDPTTGLFDATRPVQHALSMSLPFELVTTNAFVAPAVGGEPAGTAGAEGIPLGARFALPPSLDVDALSVHPLAKTILRAARDYGLYINDTNSAPLYEGLYAGSIRIEPGLVQEMFSIANNDLISIIQAEIYSVVQANGLYRIADGTSTAPTATDDAYATDEDTPLTIAAPGVLANDSDPDGDPLTALLASNPANGTLTLNADGAFTYTPATNFSGSDSFTYTANDGALDSNPATVTITVNPTNDAPVLDRIGDKSVIAGELLTFTITASDSEGDPLTFGATGLPVGAILDPGSGLFTWTPDTSQIGAHNVVFSANDGSAVDTEAVTITVAPVPDDLIFADDFETGDTSAWSSTANHRGTLSVTTEAALSGAYGLQIEITNTRPRYVRDDTPADLSRYYARFLLAPNTLSMATDETLEVFLATVKNAKIVLLQVQLGYEGGDYIVRGQVQQDDGSWLSTGWTMISSAPHAISIEWAAASSSGANDGHFDFFVDDVLVEALTGLDNDQNLIVQAYLGAPDNIGAGTSGMFFIDNFESRPQAPAGLSGTAVQLLTAESSVLLSGCTRTADYWLVHDGSGTEPVDPAWLAVGPAGSSEIFLWNYTYAYVLWRGSIVDNAWQKLGRAYIATHLNQLSGAEVPAELTASVDLAYSLLTGHSPGETLSDAYTHLFADLTLLLEGYNNGITGPGQCPPS